MTHSHTVRPMLALRSDKAGPLKFPYLVQPKLDGVRALVVGGQFQSRSGEPIANRRLQARLRDNPELALLLEGCDGELVVGPPTDPHSYRRTASIVNAHLGSLTDLRYFIFDVAEEGKAYRRLQIVTNIVAAVRAVPSSRWVEALCTNMVYNEEVLKDLEEQLIAAGYEGIVARQISAPYHHGRAGKRLHQLLKFKRFEDTELEIVGVEELMRNGNDDTRSPLGYAKRSSAQAGRIPGGTLGALICRWGSDTVRVGTGFTEHERQVLWADPPIGLLAKVRYMPHGTHEKPRHPSYQGLRAPSDLGEAGTP